jgi:hypothetical protein
MGQLQYHPGVSSWHLPCGAAALRQQSWPSGLFAVATPLEHWSMVVQVSPYTLQAAFPEVYPSGQPQM